MVSYGLPINNGMFFYGFQCVWETETETCSRGSPWLWRPTVTTGFFSQAGYDIQKAMENGP